MKVGDETTDVSKSRLSFLDGEGDPAVEEALTYNKMDGLGQVLEPFCEEESYSSIRRLT